MNKFTFKSKYRIYPNCYFNIGRYENGNVALEIWSNEEGPITRVTVNPGFEIPDDRIAIKNYSENVGMVESMKELGIIEGDPVQIIRSGWVEIPVYKLTSKGYEAVVEGS